MNRNQTLALGIVAGLLAGVFGTLQVERSTLPENQAAEGGSVSYSPQEESDGAAAPVASEGDRVPDALINAGIEAEAVLSRFDAGGGLEGYLVQHNDHSQMPMLLYLSNDGSRVLNGVMFNAEGKQLTREHFSEHAGLTEEKIRAIARERQEAQEAQGAQADQANPEARSGSADSPTGESVYDSLSKANLITQGNGEAELYALMDVNCPYCHRLYQTTQSMLDDVTVHWVMVGYRGARSAETAAAILAHDNPAEALEQAMSDPEAFDGTDIEGDREAMQANTQAAQQAGLRGTPQGVAVTADGEKNYVRGALPEAELRGELGL